MNRRGGVGLADQTSLDTCYWIFVYTQTNTRACMCPRVNTRAYKFLMTTLACSFFFLQANTPTIAATVMMMNNPPRIPPTRASLETIDSESMH
jgi:hypothetical protein